MPRLLSASCPLGLVLGALVLGLAGLATASTGLDHGEPSTIGGRNLEDARESILGDADRIPAPGVPGRVAVFGERATSVLAKEVDGAPRTVIATATVRRGGRVVAFGHGGYLSAGAMEDADGRALIGRALQWAGGELKLRERDRVFLVGATGLAGPLEELGYEVEVRERLDDEPRLVVLGKAELDAEEQQFAIELVESKGGLLCAATGWGWQQLNPGQDIATELGINAVVQRFGLAFGGGTVAGRDGGFDVADGRAQAKRENAHAGRALEALESGGSAGPGARGVLIDAAVAVPADEPTFGARLTALVGDRQQAWARGKSQPLSPDARDALAVTVLTRRLDATPVEDVEAFAGIERFPGVATTKSGKAPPATPIERTLPAGPRGRRSLGVWIPAGRVVEVALDGDAPRGRWRIGAHSDRLWSKADWERWPEVSRTAPLSETRLATPFGGLLYVELDAPNEQPLVITVDGGVEAPLLRAGGDRDAFEEQLARWPADAMAPWVELAGEHVILTVPLDAARACEDPLGVLRYWDAVWEGHSALLGRAIADRPERFVFDVQISAGWMHSGYPIMAHLPSARPALDLVRLQREGDWGLFHELGHNCQERTWTSSNMGEVTCNLFSLHAMQQSAGIAVADHERGGGLLDWLGPHRAQVAEGSAGFDELRGDPFHMLAPFVELQLAFGWEPFTAFFEQHRRAATGADPLGLGTPSGRDRDQAVRDQWAERFSRQVGRDVSGYLESCGWPLSSAVRERLSELPAWDPGR